MLLLSSLTYINGWERISINSKNSPFLFKYCIYCLEKTIRRRKKKYLLGNYEGGVETEAVVKSLN